MPRKAMIFSTNSLVPRAGFGSVIPYPPPPLHIASDHLQSEDDCCYPQFESTPRDSVLIANRVNEPAVYFVAD